MPRTEGSSFLCSAEVLRIASSAIESLDSRDGLCSVLILRFGDGMTEISFSENQGSRFIPRFCLEEEGAGQSTCAGGSCEPANDLPQALMCIVFCSTCMLCYKLKHQQRPVMSYAAASRWQSAALVLQEVLFCRHARIIDFEISLAYYRSSNVVVWLGGRLYCAF